MPEAGQRSVRVLGALLRVLSVAIVAFVLNWRLDMPLVPLVVPYLLYESLAIMWPRSTTNRRYIGLLGSLLIVGILGFRYGPPVLVGLAVLVVAAPALDIVPFERLLLILVSEEMPLSRGESRFGEDGRDRRTKLAQLTVDGNLATSENGKCPDCGADFNTLLVGTHCPKCGNPIVVEEENEQLARD